jgi:hypothetical protein
MFHVYHSHAWRQRMCVCVPKTHKSHVGMICIKNIYIYIFTTIHQYIYIFLRIYIYIYIWKTWSSLWYFFFSVRKWLRNAGYSTVWYKYIYIWKISPSCHPFRVSANVKISRTWRHHMRLRSSREYTTTTVSYVSML